MVIGEPMPHRKPERKKPADVKELKRIGDNLYRVAEQLGEFNVHAQETDLTLREIRNILQHLKRKRYWFWFRP